MIRVPVISPEGKPLMPTKASRARKWVRDGKAVGKFNDLGIYYVQLLAEPSEYNLQPIVVGVDPGKLYSGIGVQSKRHTLWTGHLELPFKAVKKRMENRRMLRRSRRGRRINRKVPFALRAHRQKRFSNRRGKKVPPSIKANRQLEQRVIKELFAIFPISKIVYEYVKADVDLTSGRKRARSGRGFSAVMVGQKWAIEQLEKLAPVETRFGYQTAQLRGYLGLGKAKDKSERSANSHAVDGIALACSGFIRYVPTITNMGKGQNWEGEVTATKAPFKVVKRPRICKRQLHYTAPEIGGVRGKYGGSTLESNLRKGDLVRISKGLGFVSGKTRNQISISDFNWKRIHRIAESRVKFIKRNNNLLVSDY